MASVLLMSLHGDGVPIALRLAQEGHIVKVYVQDKEAKKSLQGYKNPTVVGAPKMLEQFDLILYDMVGLGEHADKMKGEGHFVIGGGLFNDNLELDRDYGIKIVQKLLKGLSVPEGSLVNTKEECLMLLGQAQSKMVLKPLDNRLPGLTLVSNDSNNKFLTSVVSSSPNEVLPAILQKRIDGVEVSTEAWFNGQEFVCFNHTLEYKRLLEGERGTMTGCMGNVVWAIGEPDRIAEIALLPLSPLLEKVGFLGPLDVNCIVTEDKAYFLEFTPRFGYDAIQAYCELMTTSLFNFLWGVATKGTKFKFHQDYSCAVRLSINPYPAKDKEALKGLEGVCVLQIEEPARNHIFLSDVKMNGQEVLAGVDGVIGCVTARGESIQEVRRRCYRTIDRCVISEDVQYRKDIGAGVEAKIDKLKTWGWLDA